MSQTLPFMPEADTAARAARRAARLESLAEKTLNVLTIVERTIEQAATLPPAEAADRLPPLTRAFDRLARALRMTEALAERFEARAAAAQAAQTHANRHRTHARRQIIRGIENDIARRPAPERENLLADFHLRLDDACIEQDLLDEETIGQVLGLLRGDLGLSRDIVRDIPLRSRHAVAELHARAARGPPS